LRTGSGFNAATPGVQQPSFNGAFPRVQQPGFNGAIPGVQQPGFNGAFPRVQQPSFNGAFPRVQQPSFNGAVPSLQPSFFNGAFPRVQQPSFNGAVPSVQQNYRGLPNQNQVQRNISFAIPATAPAPVVHPAPAQPVAAYPTYFQSPSVNYGYPTGIYYRSPVIYAGNKSIFKLGSNTGNVNQNNIYGNGASTTNNLNHNSNLACCGHKKK
jgi:hypothetical protein